MFTSLHLRSAYALLSLLLIFGLSALPGFAQVGNSGSLEGVVKDPSGSAVGNASIEVSNPVSGFRRETSGKRRGLRAGGRNNWGPRGSALPEPRGR